MGEETIHDRLAQLSGSARRLLDYAALFDDGARYAVLRHMARATEEDMVEDLREVVDAGLLAPSPDNANVYGFVDDNARRIVIDGIGEARLPKLRARAEGARKRVHDD